MEDVRFGLLGSLEVRTDAPGRRLLAPRQRTLLASLLCRANQVVASEELTDTLWDGRPPGGAAATLRGYVMRVRRTLGTLGQRIETVAPGYRINLDPEHELDTARFAGLCRRGLVAAGSAQWEIAAALLDEALALWRGEPLQDVPCERLRQRELPSLLEAHLQAEQARLQAETELGRPWAAIAGLTRLVAAHPLWESPHALLMTALASCDRRAEALEIFRELRARLDGELGIEPSGELQDLHRAILAGHRPAVAARTVRAVVQVPFTLPAAVCDFTGRDAEVGRLLRHLAGARTDPGGAGAAAEITGMAGIGKTALALRVAHLLRDGFPDGQLFARLHGTGSAPARPEGVLAMFLRLLGLDAAQVPADHEERAALYRSLLNGRRVLIVLDDVRDATQVSPLLPASAGSAVLITARTRTTFLPSAERVDLGVFSLGEARTLLERTAGAWRQASEPEAVDQVLRLCAGLPLAIRIAGARLADHPHWSVRDLAERLACARGRLDELSHGAQAVRAAFEAAYRALPARSDAPGAAAAAFRALGLWPGPDLSLPAAASLIGLGEHEAERALEFLVDVNMVQSQERNRYKLHDLQAGYARELAITETPRAGRTGAKRRVIAWFASAAFEAIAALAPSRLNRRPESRRGAAMSPAFTTRAEAVAWGQREHLNLAVAERLACECGLPELSWQPPALLSAVCLTLGDAPGALAWRERALATTTGLGDHEAQALIRAACYQSSCDVVAGRRLGLAPMAGASTGPAGALTVPPEMGSPPAV